MAPYARKSGCCDFLEHSKRFSIEIYRLIYPQLRNNRPETLSSGDVYGGENAAAIELV